MGQNNSNNGSQGNAGNTKNKHGSSFAKLTEAPDNAGSTGLLTKLRNYFLTGLLVVGPMLITIYSAWWFIDFIDSWVHPYMPEIPEQYKPGIYINQFLQSMFNISLPEFSVPGVGLLFAIFSLMVIGAFTANLFGRTIIGYGEQLMNRMPIVRNVYNALKQIFETVLTSNGGSFQKAGLIEYPRKGIYSIVFISKETAGEIGSYKDEMGDELLSVFLPTTPNPTSGYLLFVPRKDIRVLNMSVEEAAKMVISAGLVEPGVADNLIKVDKKSGDNGVTKPVINSELTVNQPQQKQIHNL